VTSIVLWRNFSDFLWSCLDSFLFDSFASYFYLAAVVGLPGRFHAHRSFLGSSLQGCDRIALVSISACAGSEVGDHSSRPRVFHSFLFSRPSFPGPSS
jgi:hypothetical protein